MILYLLLQLCFLLLRCSHAATLHGPLPLDLPILHLRYPHTPWVFPGDTLPIKHTHPLPQISKLGLDPRWTYLLTFVDLDVQYGDTYTVILHLYQPDMRVSHRENFWLEPAGSHTDDGKWVMPPPGLVNSTSGAEYIAPQPPPHSYHRYVYLLFRQPKGYKFPDCFGHIFPKTVEARAGFDLRQFTDVAGLQFPVAGNYFYVDNSESVTTTTHTRTSPATTWLRSAPCGHPTTATPAPSAAAEAREHVKGSQRRQAVM